MGDVTIDPKVIEDMRKEIKRLANISEEKVPGSKHFKNLRNYI